MAVCPKCKEPSAEGVVTCAKCGTLLPDALERMIDERAHAIVAQEKATTALVEERAAHEASDKRDREALDAELKAASAAYDENMSEPATLAGSVFRSIVVVAVIAFVLGLMPFAGGMVHNFLYPAIGFTPSSVLCSHLCDGCEASAHVVRSHSGKSHVFLCKNKTIDVTKVTYYDVGQYRLQPYVLSGDAAQTHLGWFTGCVIDALIVSPCLALLLGPILGMRRRTRRLAERADLKAKRDTLLERVRMLDAQPPDAPPYRGSAS